MKKMGFIAESIGGATVNKMSPFGAALFGMLHKANLDFAAECKATSNMKANGEALEAPEVTTTTTNRKQPQGKK